MDVETCRICANFYETTSGVEFVDLFQPIQENLQRELNFIINEINAWQLNIALNDGLPQRICANCFSKFCTIDAFRQECETAQNMLHKAMESEQGKGEEAMIDIAQQELVAQESDSNEMVAVETDPSVQEMIVSNEDVAQLSTEAIFVPSNIAINYNITYDENEPTGFVINHEGTSTVPINEACINTLESVTSTNVEENMEDAEMIASENNSQGSLPQDLEDMLKGSVIPKNKLNKNANTHGTSKANSYNNPTCEEDDNEEEEDLFDDRPAQRIANFSFACNYCYCPPVGPIGHLIFKCSEALSQHFFDIHDPNLPYPCPKCPKLFKTNRRRNGHVTRAHDTASQRIIRCPYCRKVIRIPLELHENSCTYLSDWKCNVCERDFRQMPLHSFRAHQRTHYSHPNFRCEICKRDFMRRSNLEAHKKVHEQKSPTTTGKTCIECKLTFASVAELKDHEWIEHAGKALFRCEYCDKGYSSLVFLQRHISNLHSQMISQNTDQLTCSNCNVTFPSKLKLYFHQERPKDENGQCILLYSPKGRPRNFSCPHCYKRFGKKDQLDLHLEIHDARLRPHACDRCTVRCRTASDLKQHINLVHLNELVFTCEECDERFAYKKDLENHKLYHAKITFKCSLQSCKASFPSEGELSHHIHLIHEPISCEYCGEIFTRNELKVHQKSESCLTDTVFGKVNGTTKALADTFNPHNEHSESQLDATNSSTSSNSNVCVQYVNEQPQSIVLKDDETTTTQIQQSVLDFLQSAADANIIHAPDVPLNDDDYFISSLLDPDNEIVVT